MRVYLAPTVKSCASTVRVTIKDWPAGRAKHVGTKAEFAPAPHPDEMVESVEGFSRERKKLAEEEVPAVSSVIELMETVPVFATVTVSTATASPCWIAAPVICTAAPDCDEYARPMAAA